MITDDAVARYVEGLVDLTSSLPASEAVVLGELIDKTMTVPGAGMMMGAYQGGLLRILVRATGACRILEIGTFTGFSALCMALGTLEGEGDDALVTTVDVNAETTELAKTFWSRSAAGDRIQPIIGDALQVAGSLEGPFDLVLVDADKERLGDYWETVLPLVRTGGLILVDNTLRGGKVADATDDLARMVDAFNRRVAGDSRVDTVLVTVRDGLTIAAKRPVRS